MLIKKKMKNYYLTAFLIILFSCLNKDYNEETVSSGIFYPKVEKRSVIIGKIKNIKEFSSESKTIRLIVDDITINKQLKYITTIDENGNFLLNIPLNNPINTYLKYSDETINTYIFPNDTLFVDYKLKKTGSLIDRKSILYDEKHHEFQKEFQKQYRWIYNKIIIFKKSLSKNLSRNELKTKFLTFEKVLHGKIDSRIKNKQSNQLIYNYLKYSSTYYLYKDIIKIGKGIDNKEDKKVFFSFLTDSIVFNKDALKTSIYRIFLAHYYKYVETQETITIIKNNKSEEEKKREFLLKNIETKIKLRTGIWKDYLIASIIKNKVIDKEQDFSDSTIDDVIKLVQEKIKDNYTKQLTTSMLEKEKISIIKRDNSNSSQNHTLQNTTNYIENELYNDILTKNKGKVIYVDFWATWCKPCIEQFPYSKKLHSKYENKDVSFVFLCCRSKKEAAENILKKYQLKGQHYILNQKQYEYFEKKFNIVGLPRYVLIDKKGKVYTKKASKPKYENTSIMIEELLKEE